MGYKLKYMLVFLIALIANVIEDLVLLYFYNVPITKQVLIAGVVFSLSFMFFLRLIEYGILKKDGVQ